MKAICWAYDDDGRICRQPAASLDQQRGFMVCQKHGLIREDQTPTRIRVMSKNKPPATGTSAATASEANEPREYRNIPEVDAKIDAYIRENPKRWAYIQEMPRDRLERALVLSDVQKAPERDDATHQQKSRTQTGLRNVGEERSRRPAGRGNGSNRLPGASGHWSRTVNDNSSLTRNEHVGRFLRTQRRTLKWLPS